MTGKYPGILMELKWGKDLNDKALNQLSEEALCQIEENGYATEMYEEGIKDIIILGIAFSGKKCVISNT